MQILLFPVGSAGDVFPFVALGQRLLERGHDVTLFTNGYFTDTIQRANIPFVETDPRELFEQMERDADLWHPLRAFRTLFGHPEVANSIRRQYSMIAERYRPGDTVVAAGTLAFGPRIARDKLGVPLVSIHLSPAVFKSIERTPRYASIGMRAWWPRWLKRGMFWLGNRYIVDPILGPTINGIRRELDLPPVQHILTEWIHSPDRVLALFPEWFAPRPSDWPPQTRLTGFPLFDNRGQQPLGPALLEFLAAGPPPIVATFGSAMRFAAPYFAAVAAALGRLGRRGVLLTPHREQLPNDLPIGVRHFDYAPLGLLLPQSAMLIHHGGIGTTAQALAAGVPQIVVPFAHDQPDNAERLRLLGVGQALYPKRCTVRNVMRTLTALDTDEVRVRSRSSAEKLAGNDPLAATCDLIEQAVHAPR